MPGIDYRPDHRSWRVRVAYHQRPDTLDEALRKSVVEAVVNDDPVHRHADLPLMQELAEHGSIHRLFKVGIVQHH
ncbi:hypothetical protein D3C79_1029180 [compost metagenome]